jgi:nicotinamidase-related amidase
MPPLQKLDPQSAALLVMDCQKGVVDVVPGSDRIFKQAGRVVAAARAAQIPVIHVGLGFRPGYPEIHPRHPIFGMVRQTGRFLQGSESAGFHESVEPLAGEIIVYKHRVSAFSGNDLEMILRSQSIRTLVLIGIATSGIVLSTLRQAADMDFPCVVIRDCCADGDDEVHRVLTEKVFPRQATVVSADEFLTQMLG